MKKNQAFLVERTTHTGGWRNSTYERSDGSRFNVAIPICEDPATFKRAYNETAEAEMLLQLVGEAA